MRTDHAHSKESQGERWNREQRHEPDADPVRQPANQRIGEIMSLIWKQGPSRYGRQSCDHSNWAKAE